jgi:hypothetical protein
MRHSAARSRTSARHSSRRGPQAHRRAAGTGWGRPLQRVQPAERGCNSREKLAPITITLQKAGFSSGGPPVPSQSSHLQLKYSGSDQPPGGPARPWGKEAGSEARPPFTPARHRWCRPWRQLRHARLPSKTLSGTFALRVSRHLDPRLPSSRLQNGKTAVTESQHVGSQPERVLPGDVVRVEQKARMSGGEQELPPNAIVAEVDSPAAGRQHVEQLLGSRPGCWWKRTSPAGRLEPVPGKTVVWEYMQPHGDSGRSTGYQVHWARPAAASPGAGDARITFPEPNPVTVTGAPQARPAGSHSAANQGRPQARRALR